MTDNSEQDRSKSSLWVLEGNLDLPVFFDSSDESADRKVKSLFLDFSGASGDGIIELQACNLKRVNESVWWSPDEPVLFEFRACVLAASLPDAWRRSADFLEQMLDRLTFIAGAPVRLIQTGMLYNESELQQCRAGTAVEFECTTHGLPCRTTKPFSNMHVVDKLMPSDRAKRALRWFRKAMCSLNPEDRFLAYYFSLECVSNDVKKTPDKTHTCQSCGKSTGINKAQIDGIKYLIARHEELPKSLFSKLGKTRAKLVHGGDASAEAMAKQLEPITRVLAAEGITMSLELDPDTVRIQETTAPTIMPIMKARFDDASDHLERWGQSMTSLIEKLQKLFREREGA